MGKTIISKDNRFEWDEEKNIANIEKHGIAFEEILEVFDRKKLGVYLIGQ